MIEICPECGCRFNVSEFTRGLKEHTIQTILCVCGKASLTMRVKHKNLFFMTKRSVTKTWSKANDTNDN